MMAKIGKDVTGTASPTTSGDEYYCSKCQRIHHPGSKKWEIHRGYVHALQPTMSREVLPTTPAPVTQTGEVQVAPGLVQVQKPAPVPQEQRPTTELKELIKKAETGKRVFPGFKAAFDFDFEGTKIVTEVRYETIKVEPLVKTVQKTVDGRKVRWGRLGLPGRMGYLDEQNQEVPADMVRTYQILPDGREQQITPFEKTKEIKPYKYVDKSALVDFLPSSYVVVWGGEELKNIADKMNAENKVGVIKFSHGGMKAYHGFVYPVYKDGKFALEIMLTEGAKTHQRWMSTEKKPKEIVSTKTAEIPEI